MHGQLFSSSCQSVLIESMFACQGYKIECPAIFCCSQSTGSIGLCLPILRHATYRSFSFTLFNVCLTPKCDFLFPRLHLLLNQAIPMLSILPPFPSEKRRTNIWMLTLIHILGHNCLKASRKAGRAKRKHRAIQAGGSAHFTLGHCMQTQQPQIWINTRWRPCVLIFPDLLWTPITFYTLFLAAANHLWRKMHPHVS